MPHFGKESLRNLKQLHPDLQMVLREAIKEFDFKIMDAQRGRAEQEYAFKKGNTKAHFGQSAHNYIPAIACDIYPYPIDFDDIGRFKDMARVVLRIAKAHKVPLRWGGDWNMDGNTADGWDFPHFELHPWRTWAKKSKLIGV